MRVYENQEETLRVGRNSYRMIKWDFFDASHMCCRNLITSNQKWGYKPVAVPTEYIWAYEQSENAYCLPIENLMFNVIAFIANAGRYNGTYNPYGHWASDHFEDYIHEKLQKLLEKNDLQEMLSELPKEERREFEDDLRILKLVK